MTVTLLISEEQIKELTGINEGVDINLLRPYIKTAQEMRIEPILGTELYDYILENRDALTGVYSTLYTEHIQPTLSWYAIVEALPTIMLRVGNGGVYSNAPTNGNQATTSQFSYIEQNYKSKADYYASRMSDYLCNYSENFPELNTNTLDDLKPSPVSSNWGFGLEPTNPTNIVRYAQKRH